jgi:cob(I)alamin adenosyltransferase
LTRIYTRGGDDGMTSLGGGQRVRKHSLRVAAYGEVDELNSQIGLAVSCGPEPQLARVLRDIQNELFHLGSDLCILEEDKERMQAPCIEQRHVDALEQLLDRLGEELGPLENFILPGGSHCAARLHVARAVCRRAERAVVALAEAESISPLAVRFLNRLSDALFMMARKENQRRGVPDVLWDSHK